MQVLSGRYMFWSAGFKNASYPTTNLVAGTFGDINAKYRSIYIGSGNTGAVLQQREKQFMHGEVIQMALKQTPF